MKHKKLGGALVSLDFFKAYDRLFLPFLLKVFEKMNLSGVFSDWIRMLLHGARTRFILDFLTNSIEINFSVRQGDLLAILLYVMQEVIHRYIPMNKKYLIGIYL